MDYPLDEDDIRALLGSETRIITYPELAKYKSMDELLDRNGRAVILFLTDPKNRKTGHWIGVFTRPDGAYETFDAYGLPYGGPKRWLTGGELKDMGQSKPLLTNLLAAAGKPVYVSRMPLQKAGRDIATCGRWLALRMMLSRMPDDEFWDMAHSYPGLSPDAWVSNVIDVLLQRI